MEKKAIATPDEVLAVMVANDKYSEWLGLKVDEIGEGYCKLHYMVRADMMNGFQSIHGGVLFSASDSAFAFSCNSHGVLTVALDVSISFIRPAKTGDILYVEAKELYLGGRTGVYDIRTTNEAGELVALFKGTAYRTSREIEPLPVS